ncbi:hypothetical protein CSA56_12815 [candidate division KSB3 bacterium]|uniref:NACHT domain-containing protein n=1 Tax=candidate division KSB3 bacterium TaxID=2044937 RepID=A0A2G6KEG4_9BACT|nr:MAG: hypothetical protein CSA56_12815 [candidate division KSB3 bacterium]
MAAESDVLANYRDRMLHETEQICLSGIPCLSDSTNAPKPLKIALNRFLGHIQAIQEEQQRNTETTLDVPSLAEGGDQGSLFNDILITLYRSGETLYRQGEVYRELERPDPTNPVSALQYHHRLVILGAPGSGKSTLLQHLAREAAGNTEGPIPILLPLQCYTHAMARQKTVSLRTFALNYAAKGDAELRSALEHVEHILWLLDDSETNSAGWNAIVSQIAALSGDIAITSRPSGYQSAGLETFAHYEILPMKAGEIDRFLEDCFIALSECRSTNWDWAEVQTIRLKNLYEQKSRKIPFISTPLLLTFLCVFSESEHLQELPERRTELYGCCLESLLDFWGNYSTSIRRSTPPFTPGDIPQEKARHIVLDSIYYLGWYVHTYYYESSSRLSPTQQAAIKALSDYLERTQAIHSSDWTRVSKEILQFWKQAGVLVSVESVEETFIMFRHPLFREYAAACRIHAMFQENFRSTWRYLFPRLHHYAWQEPLVMAGCMMDEQQLSNVMTLLLTKHHSYERAIHRNLLLAAAFLREDTACPDFLKKDISHKLGALSLERRKQRLVILRLSFLTGLLGIPTVLFLFSSFPSWGIGLITLLWGFAWYAAFFEVSVPDLQFLLAFPCRMLSYIPDRQFIIQLLAQNRMPESVPYLIQALDDSQPEVRRAAVEALGKTGDTRSIPALTQAMNNLPGSIRKIAAFAIQKIGDIPSLIQALGSEQEEVRHAAAEALGESESELVITKLAQKLVDAKVYTRRLVVDVLKKIGGEFTIPPLVQALSDDDREVRQTAIEALKQIGIGESPYSRLHITTHLVKGLDDCESSVQWATACALGQIRDPDTLPALIQALRRNSNYVSRGISDAVQQIVTQHSRSYMVKFFNDDNATVRKTAVMTLGQIGIPEPEALLALIGVLRDHNSTVRREAAEALGKLRNEQALPALIDALHDSEWRVRWAAAEALGKSGSPDAIAPLLQLLKDSHQHVCRVAIEGLGKSGEMAVIPFLIQELKSTHPSIRSAATEALRQIGEAQTVPFLLQAAKYEEEEHIRQDAEDALRQIGDVRAIPYLLDALQDDEVHIRRIAVEVLGQIHSMETVTPLITVLHDTDETLRSLAADVLGRLEASEAVPMLLTVLQDRSPIIRRSAARALGRIWEPEAVPDLIRLLDDNDVGVRLAVIEALGRIGDPEAVPALIETLRQTTGKERWGGAYALGRIRDVRAIPLLLECLTKDHDANVRRASAEALGQIGHPQPVPGLLKALNDEYWFVCWAAAHSLGYIRDLAAVDGLIGLLKNTHEKVRWAAAEALGQIGDPKAAPALISALRDTNWEVCKIASRSLDRVSRAETIPHLIRAMQQGNHYVRRAVVSALNQIQDENALPYLIQALQNPSPSIRQVATHNLLRLKTPQIIPKLLPLMRHQDTAVRTCTAQILGRVAHVVQNRKDLKQAARTLWWRLTDHDDVAKAAFYALNHVTNRLSVLEVEQRFER